MAAFVAEQPGRALALARGALERAVAVNDWINAADDRPVPSRVAATPRARDPARRIAALPEPPALPETPLAGALARRRSAYAFSPAPFDLPTLSSLLRHAVGIGRRVGANGRRDHPLGVAPSAGGLESVAVYVSAANVDALPAGHYAFERDAHTLVELAACDARAGLRRMYGQREFADRCAVSLALVARLEVCLAKYSLRHYRTVHVDVGIVAQNLYLVATALGLSACAVAGFRDDAVADVLGIERHELPVLLFAVGHAPS